MDTKNEKEVRKDNKKAYKERNIAFLLIFSLFLILCVHGHEVKVEKNGKLTLDLISFTLFLPSSSCGHKFLESMVNSC